MPPFVSGVVPPAARGREEWYALQAAGLVLVDHGAGLALPDETTASPLALDRAAAHYLGQHGERAAFAVAHDGAPLPRGYRVLDLRSVLFTLGEPAFAVVARAAEVVHWAEQHRFCGRCGTATAPVPGERCLRCPACALTAYPRVTPAVIVLVRRGEEALLARNVRFPKGGYYSTLAGFVEAGETLEETVAREIAEEVGVEVTNLRYFGSQAWPFPHSLMIGFLADWAGGAVRPDGTEILDALWFTRDALPPLPPHGSIARRLIDTWLDGSGGRGAAKP